MGPWVPYFPQKTPGLGPGEGPIWAVRPTYCLSPGNASLWNGTHWGRRRIPGTSMNIWQLRRTIFWTQGGGYESSLVSSWAMSNVTQLWCGPQQPNIWTYVDRWPVSIFGNGHGPDGIPRPKSMSHANFGSDRDSLFVVGKCPSYSCLNLTNLT